MGSIVLRAPKRSGLQSHSARTADTLLLEVENSVLLLDPLSGKELLKKSFKERLVKSHLAPMAARATAAT